MMDLKRTVAAGIGLVMIVGAGAGVVAAASPDDEPVAGSAEPVLVTDYVVEAIPASQPDAEAYGGEEYEAHEQDEHDEYEAGEECDDHEEDGHDEYEEGQDHDRS